MTKLLKLLVFVMAFVGQELAITERNGIGTTNYRLASVSYGRPFSTSLEGVSPVNNGNISNPIQGQIMETASSRGLTRRFDKIGNPRPFKFRYNLADELGNKQYHKQEADESGRVTGSYGYTDIQGLYRVVDYIADANGFRASIRTNEPGTIGKRNPANVQMMVDHSVASIQDKYKTFIGNKGEGPSTSHIQSEEKVRYNAPIEVPKIQRPRYVPPPKVSPIYQANFDRPQPPVRPSVILGILVKKVYRTRAPISVPPRKPPPRPRPPRTQALQPIHDRYPATSNAIPESDEESDEYDQNRNMHRR